VKSGIADAVTALQAQTSTTLLVDSSNKTLTPSLSFADQTDTQ